MCGNKRELEKRNSLPVLDEDQSSSTLRLPDEALGADQPERKHMNREDSLKLEALQQDREANANRDGPVSDNEFMKRVAHQSVNDVGGWTCEKCTYVNRNEEHLSCEVCGAERLKETADFGHKSMEDFLSSSMSNALDTKGSEEVERQMGLYRDFEEQLFEKETMSRLVMHQRKVMSEIVLNEARARKEEEAAHLQTQEGMTTYLRNLREQLQSMELAHIEEREQIHAMAALQAERRREIERDERVDSIYELVGGGAQQPGALRVSNDALEWIAQQRMLEDWRAQLTVNETETSTLRQQYELARSGY